MVDKRDGYTALFAQWLLCGRGGVVVGSVFEAVGHMFSAGICYEASPNSARPGVSLMIPKIYVVQEAALGPLLPFDSIVVQGAGISCRWCSSVDVGTTIAATSLGFLYAIVCRDLNDL